MINLFDGPLITLEDGLLDGRCRCAFSAREIEHGHAEFLQVVILPHPIVSDHENVDVQLFDDIRMIQRPLRDDDVRVLEGLDDGNPLLKGDDGRVLVARHQLIGADAHDEGIAQTTGVFNHLEMVGVEHVECSGGIDNDFIVVHVFCFFAQFE